MTIREEDDTSPADTTRSEILDRMRGASLPDWIISQAPTPVFSPAIDLPDFDFGPSTTPEDTLDAVTRSAEHAEKQTALLDAMSKASAEQVQTLAVLRKLSEDLASERRLSAAREDIQQGFNRRMSWAALLLAGAAVVVPFVVLLIEQGLR